MVKKNEPIDVEALYEEVTAVVSPPATGFVDTLLAELPEHVAEQALKLLKDGEHRSNRNVAATLERLRVMFKVEVAPGKPGKSIGNDHVQRWRASRGIKY